jgi:hypothetical protein
MGNEDKQAAQAKNILKMLFSGIEGNVVTRETILDKVSDKTFHNYNPLLVRQELVKAMYDGRAISSLALTDKGLKVLGRTVQTQIPVAVKEESMKAEAPATADLDEITALTDEFNRHSQRWEWKLVRKEVPQAK